MLKIADSPAQVFIADKFEISISDDNRSVTITPMFKDMSLSNDMFDVFNHGNPVTVEAIDALRYTYPEEETIATISKYFST